MSEEKLNLKIIKLPKYAQRRYFIRQMCYKNKVLTTTLAMRLCEKNKFKHISRNTILRDFRWLSKIFKDEFEFRPGKSGRSLGPWISSKLIYKGTKGFFLSDELEN